MRVLQDIRYQTSRLDYILSRYLYAFTLVQACGRILRFTEQLNIERLRAVTQTSHLLLQHNLLGIELEELKWCLNNPVVDTLPYPFIQTLLPSSWSGGRRFESSDPIRFLQHKHSPSFVRTVLSSKQNRKKLQKACPGSPKACRRRRPFIYHSLFDGFRNTYRKKRIVPHMRSMYSRNHTYRKFLSSSLRLMWI